MKTFDLHGLILCDSEGVLSEMLCIHTVDKETFVLHGLIVDVSEDYLCLWLCSRIVDIDVFYAPY